MELAVDRGREESISAQAHPSFTFCARARARVLSRLMAFWALGRMRAGFPRSRGPAASGSRTSFVIGLVLLTQCSPDRQVLFGPSEQPIGVDEPAAAGGVAVGGTGGSPGDVAAGGSSAGTGGSSTGTGGSVGGTGGIVCLDPGPGPATCDHGFELVMHLHAGCAVLECGPVNDCSSDLNCPSGSVCFAGAQCDDGCTTPECCSGNHCGSPSCPAPTNMTCLAVGCPAGGICSAACDTARCSCDGANWTCTYDAGAVTSCPSACLMP
jgi:hypothetical protein